MISRCVKCLLVAAFSLFFINFAAPVIAQDHKEDAAHQDSTHGEEKKGGFDAQEVIFGHVLNAHEFHFIDLPSGPVTIPLPVILYSSGRGFTSFMSSYTAPNARRTPKSNTVNATATPKGIFTASGLSSETSAPGR